MFNRLFTIAFLLLAFGQTAMPQPKGKLALEREALAQEEEQMRLEAVGRSRREAQEAREERRRQREAKKATALQREEEEARKEAVARSRREAQSDRIKRAFERQKAEQEAQKAAKPQQEEELARKQAVERSRREAAEERERRERLRTRRAAHERARREQQRRDEQRASERMQQLFDVLQERHISILPEQILVMRRIAQQAPDAMWNYMLESIQERPALIRLVGELEERERKAEQQRRRAASHPKDFLHSWGKKFCCAGFQLLFLLLFGLSFCVPN